MFLDHNELADLTGLRRPSAQYAWLRENGWPVERNARGRPLVLRTVDARRVRWSDWRTDGLHVRVSKTSAALVFDRTPELEALMAELRNRFIGSVFVIAERNGSAWTYKRLYSEWQRVAPAGANLHDLRRKRITDLTRERGREFAQQVATHSDPRQTAGYDVGERRVKL